MKTKQLLFLATCLLIATSINAQQLTKGSVAYYESMRIAYQTKIDWVLDNPTEHNLAVENNWYKMANANVQQMITNKSLAKKSSNGIYLPQQNRDINTEPQAGGDLCQNAAPFCTDYIYTFPCGTSGNAAEAGPDYGCLGSEPNPAWYYMQIENSGDVLMSLSAPQDIDFIIWGPFTEFICDYALLDESHIVDCSYSSTNEETPEIGPGSSEGATTATAGEWYIFMITNFSQATQDFTLSQTGGGGTTNQMILNTGIFDVAKEEPSKINIFPNPSNGIYEITGLDYSEGELIVLDLAGRVLINQQINSNTDSKQLNVSDFNNGIYQIIVKQKDAIVKKSIVIQK